MEVMCPLSITACIVRSESLIRQVKTPLAARTFKTKGRTFASRSLSRGRESVGGCGIGGGSSALGGSVGEVLWSVALIADLVRERSLDIFVSETVTVAIGNCLFCKFALYIHRQTNINNH